MAFRKFQISASIVVLSAINAVATLGATQSPPESGNHGKTVEIDSVYVIAPRRMSDIGTQKTKIGESVLHESLATSMADILSQSSYIFVKSYGRGTLATISTRGTAPSHTQVTWNGMKINSPMLGMTDLSYIPSIFIDEAALYYGATSTGVTGGGLGGALTLETRREAAKGFAISYTQGVGSFRTFDQFLRTAYGGGRWSGSTRAAYTVSANDFPYTNYNKKDFITDADGNVVGFDYPVTRNANCALSDLHLLQEFSFDGGRAGRFGMSAWWMKSSRGIPQLDVDYRDGGETRSQQDEQTLRIVADWKKSSGGVRFGARGGYLYSDLLYLWSQSYDGGADNRTADAAASSYVIERVHARSYVQTVFGQAELGYSLREKWHFAAEVTLHQNFARTHDSAYVPISPEDPNGYDVTRTELSGFASARWKPTERFGAAINLRAEMSGDQWAPPIPALFLEYRLSQRGDVVLKASAARNYRFPTFNDLYFKSPSEGYGRRDLRPERGFTYDGGIDFVINGQRRRLRGGLSAYDSYIHDWILWRPDGGASFTALNVALVHSYGGEANLAGETDLGRSWKLTLSGLAGYTRSVNRGEPMSDLDNSVGKQLPYIPVWSAAVNGRLSWGEWAFTWKWNYYGERYTSTDNSQLISGTLLPYFMNDITLGRDLSFRRCSLSLKVAVNNLFDEEYVTVLSRPMPGRNYGVYISVTPLKFGRK